MENRKNEKPSENSNDKTPISNSEPNDKSSEEVISNTHSTRFNTTSTNTISSDIATFKKLNRYCKHPYFIPILLFIFAIVLYLMLKNGGLWHFDSYADAVTVEQMLETKKLEYSYGYGAPGAIVTIFPFYYIDHLITGQKYAERAYFFVNFLTATLGIILLYFICMRLFRNKFIATAASLFLLATPIFFSATSYPKTHSISVLYGLLGGWLLLKATDYEKNHEDTKEHKDSDNKKSKWMNYLLIGLSGFAFSLNIAIRPDGIFYLIPFCLLYLSPKISMKKLSFAIPKNRFTIKKILLFIFCLFIIWFLLFLPKIQENGFAELNPSTETRGGWQGFFSDNLKPSFGHLTISITWLGWFTALIGLWYCWKKELYLEGAFLVLFFVETFFFYGNLAVIHARFLIPALIPLVVLMALGCYVVYYNKKSLGILLVAILVVWMFATIYPIVKSRHDYSGTKEFGKWVGEVTEDNAVVMTNDLGFFVQRYGNRKIIFHPRSADSKEIEGFMRELRDYSSNNISIYATREGFAIDPGELVQKALLQEYDVLFVGQKTTEWYGDGTLKLALYDEPLLKLVPKNKINAVVNTAN